jgi:hypothetical protein
MPLVAADAPREPTVFCGDGLSRVQTGAARARYRAPAPQPEPAGDGSAAEAGLLLLRPA